MHKIHLPMLLLMALLIAPCFQLKGQALADSLVQQMLAKAYEVQSFRADVDIEVDVEFIRIPVRKGRVFYKAPDKFRFRAGGFVLLPRRGFDHSLHQMLEEPHAAIYAGTDSLGHMLKIVPMSPEADYRIATLWVDEKYVRVNKMEVTTTGQGSFNIQMRYGDIAYDLPIETTISFEVSPIEIPMKFIGSLSLDQSKLGERNRGSVNIRYSNYRINGEIPDSVFEEDGEE